MKTIQMQIGQLVKLTKCHFLFFENKHTHAVCAGDNNAAMAIPGGRLEVGSRLSTLHATVCPRCTHSVPTVPSVSAECPAQWR